MQYGYFDDAKREYIITDPRTPVKWINYIGTLQFGGFVDHTGGALICKGDPTFNRITKYIQQMPSSDFKGETLYLRVRKGDRHEIFSPFFVPGLTQLDRFESHIGLGYIRIVSEYRGVRTDATIFVPLNEACELRDIQVTNIGAEALDVDAIPVVEYTHPDALKQFTNADWIPQTVQSRLVRDGEFTVLLQYPFMFRESKINYFTSSLPASSFETDRRKFLGDNEYGTWMKPLSLASGELSNTEAQRGDNMGALMHRLGVLQAGETKRLVVQLGQAASFEAANATIGKFRRSENVDAALDEIKMFWNKYLAALQVHTPDAAMNSMLNIHNPHQCFITKQWSRYLSYYQLGMGSRGIGIRDSSQDVLAVLASIPEDAKDFIRTLLTFQKRDGSSMHQFNPLTMEGSVGDSIEMEDRPHYYSDDHLWNVLTVTAYIKETGDIGFLSEAVPFYDRDKEGNAIERASVLEHLKRALAFTRRDVGSHGLPLLGFADWNDTINLPKGAESLFSANLYGRALNEMISLLEFIGDGAVEDFRSAYAEMKARMDPCAWDGEWYVMYFDHEGKPVGSHENRYGRIHLNAQSWAVLSGFAPAEHARQAMDSVYEHLSTKYGIKLSTPGFNGYDPKFGGVTTYPPGAKENGGIFLHPNPWAMIAEAMLGHGDRAYEYYSQINQAAKNDIAEVYEVEPYVYAQNILGDEHPQFGLGRNSWLSGTASWCYQAGTQWILGIRPEYTGLCIDPCIPSSWSGFEAVRRYRGVRYEIHVERRGTGNGMMLEVDGRAIQGKIIPLPPTGTKIVNVTVKVG